MRGEPAVSLRGVSRRFGEIQAVRNLDMDIERGAIHGLLGPNGSGKSTAMKMVLGLLGLPVSLALTEAVSLAIAVVSFRAARGQLEKLYEREY